MLLALGVVVCLAGAAAAALRETAPDTALVVVIAAVVAAAAIVALPAIDPAVPLSAGLLTTVFSGNWQSLGIPLGLDRPLLLYGIAGVLVQALPDAFARRRIRVAPLHWLLLAVAVYAIGSALFAGTLFEREPLFALLDKLGIIGFLLFLVAPVAFATRRSRDGLLVCLIGLGLYLGITAVLERLDLRAFVFPRYINDPSVGIHFDRARGPFVEAAINGFALYTCLVAAAMGWARWPRPALRTLCAVTIALCGLGVVLTLTRQVWVAAAVATPVALLVTPGARRYVVPALVLGLVVVAAAFTFVPGLQASASARTGDDRSVWDRLNSNRAAVHMLDEHPLVGTGWFTFQRDSGPYYTQAATYPLTTVPRPHNVFLSNVSELGLVGGVAWILALLLAVGRGVVGRPPPAGDLKLWRAGLVAVFVAWVVVANLSPFGAAFNNHLIWLWAGICWVPFACGAERAA